MVSLAFAFLPGNGDVRQHKDAHVLLDTSGDIDADGLGNGEGAVPVEGGPPPERVVIEKTKFRKWCVAMLRSKIGYQKRSEANRLMVDKVIRDLLAEHHVRPTQWHSHIPVISAMYFIPSDAELEARSLLGSDEAWRRESAAKESLVSGGWWRQRMRKPLGYNA